MSDEIKNQHDGARPFLDDFLKEDEPAAAAAPAGTPDPLEADAIEMLRTIYDPEIPVNIYDLGLIYNVENDEGHVLVAMTLTSPHCPVAETMPGEVEMRIGSVPGVREVTVNLVWDPPWTPENMSEAAKLELGFL